MPQQHTPSDQVKFLSQWFLSWSEMQREDFLPVLLQAYQPCDNLNGLVGGYESLGTRGRRPSLFDCQMKLFHDWFGAWTETDRQTLLEDLRELDPEFMRQYEKRMSGEAPLEDPSAATSAGDESQESQNPPSSISSPPSTLPRSHSPHDSGLDEPATDSEHVDPENQKKDDVATPGDDSNTTTITINTSSSSTTTTINTASPPPPPPPVKPANNVTVVEVGGDGGSGGDGGGERVFSMQDLANGLSVDAQNKATADGEAAHQTQQPQQECESVSAEH